MPAREPICSGGPGTSANAGVDNLTQVVETNFLKPAELVSLISNSVPGSVQISATSQNKMIVSGPRQDVETALKLISAFDVESALSKTVRVRLTAKVVVTTSKGAKTYDESTESVGADGPPSLLNLQAVSPYNINHSTVTAKGNRQAVVAQLHYCSTVDATLVPTVNADGQIGLAGRGRSSSASSAPAQQSPLSCRRTSMSPHPRFPKSHIAIAAGTVSLDAGKVEFTVTITATLEQGRVRNPQAPNAPKAADTVAAWEVWWW